MKLALGVAVLVAACLAASACGSSHRTNGPPVTNESSSPTHTFGGTVQCTASLPTSVEAGHLLDVVFTFHNVSKRTANVDLQYGGMWLVVRSPDGTRYDSRIPFENQTGPPPHFTPIAPGATKTARFDFLRVRWEGPLRITPGCGQTTLRPVRVAVKSPGPPASDGAAMKAVVAASGHLLDHCRPRASGVSVVGRLDPPSGSAPPMQARCSITLRHERGFDVAQVLVVTPPDMKGVHVEQTYQALTGTGTQSGNTEAIAWQLVVTRRAATSTGGSEVDSSLPGGGLAPSWDWTGSRWEGPGGSRCGGYGSSVGPGPPITFISVCGR